MLRRPFDALLASFFAFALIGIGVAACAQETAEDAPAAEPAETESATESSSSEPAATDPADTSTAEPETPSEEAPEEAAEPPAAPGQADLDKAIELKLTANGLRDLNKVVELLESALEEGVAEGNEEFANSMLVATLLQRASALSAAVLDKPVANPTRDLRWLQIRQFALTDLQRALEIDSNLPEANLLIGRLQSLQPVSDPNAARRAFTKVIKAEGIEPERLAQAHALRGATQSDATKRLADFSRAVELDPDKVEYRLLRAREYQQSKKFDEALVDIEVLLDKVPENSKVHEMKALVLLSQNKPEEAIKSFDRATELAPNDIRPYQFRGEAYSRMGDTAEALEQLNKAVEIDPNNVGSRLVRTQLYLLDGQPEAALADIESVLARQPGLLRGHIIRVQVLEELGRRDDAVEALQRISQAAADQPEVLMQLATLYQGLNEYDEAIGVLTQIIDRADDNVLALRLRGDMYLSIGEHLDALADFARAYELRPDDPGLLNNYAWTLATSPHDDLRNGKRALELATRAAELTEFEKPHILSTLAAAYAEVGDFDRAVEFAEKAVEMEQEKGAGPEAGEDIEVQLSDELASYRDGKPWRELQQAGEEAPLVEPSAVDPAIDPAGDDEPDGAFDF